MQIFGLVDFIEQKENDNNDNLCKIHGGLYIASALITKDFTYTQQKFLVVTFKNDTSFKVTDIKGPFINELLVFSVILTWREKNEQIQAEITLA